MAAMARNAAVLLVLLGVVLQLCSVVPPAAAGRPQGAAVPAAAASVAAAAVAAAAAEKVVDQRGSLTVADLNVTTQHSSPELVTYLFVASWVIDLFICFHLQFHV